MLPIWLTDTVTADVARALHYTLLWGLEGVELRTIGHERVPFVNEGKLKKRLQADELPVAAISPGLFEGPVEERAAWLNEIAALADTFQFCRRLGCPVILTSGFSATPDFDQAAAVTALRHAGEQAARHGLTLAILNELGMAHETGAGLASLLDAVDHPAVQAAWDPAAALQAGEPPAKGARLLAERIAFVRCYDGHWKSQQWLPCALGEGSIGWGEHLRLLQEIGYHGPVSLLLNVAPKPKQGLRDASTLIRLIRQTQQR